MESVVPILQMSETKLEGRRLLIRTLDLPTGESLSLVNGAIPPGGSALCGGLRLAGGGAVKETASGQAGWDGQCSRTTKTESQENRWRPQLVLLSG